MVENTENKPEIRVFDRDLVFFDTETTGLAHSAEITEIGYVKVKAKTFEMIGEGDIKMKPDHPELANTESMQINGYDEAEWNREAVPRLEGFKKFLSVTQDVMLVGHNLPFDRIHVERELELLGFEPNYFYKGLDTFVMAWSLLGDQPPFFKFSLGELSKFFNIDQGRVHRAIDDARTTYKVFLELSKLAKK
ncbi:MAG: 3'-5' exonuclease [Candidatus Liptonbacteria bacterium]